MTHRETARASFEACETGQGWDACKTWCALDASFSCQADALASSETLAAYCDWMKGLLTPMPNGRYELTAFAWDEARQTAVAAEFHRTQTGDGGPVPPIGKAVVSDYAHVMRFEGGKIAHTTKIWNDVYALRGLDWA